MRPNRTHPIAGVVPAGPPIYVVGGIAYPCHGVRIVPLQLPNWLGADSQAPGDPPALGDRLSLAPFCHRVQPAEGVQKTSDLIPDNVDPDMKPPQGHEAVPNMEPRSLQAAGLTRQDKRRNGPDPNARDGLRREGSEGGVGPKVHGTAQRSQGERSANPVGGRRP